MGQIQILRDVYSQTEDVHRIVRVYTPNEYDWQVERSFPVAYLLDGQNVFNHKESALFDTWCANTSMERLIAEDRMPPWILVGVDHLPNRREEYSPWDEPGLGQVGRGRQTASFLARQLKPYIDKTFRTQADAVHTAVIGSGLGGLFALWLHMEHPSVFGRVGALSPDLAHADGHIFQHVTAHTRQWTKIWLDCGTNERLDFEGLGVNHADTVRDFHRHLQSLGYGDWEARLFIEPGANHHEVDWQRRLPMVFEWLLAEIV